MVRGKSRSHSRKGGDELSVRHIDLKSYSKIAALLMAVNGLIMDVLVYAGASMGMEPYATLHSFGLAGYLSVFFAYFASGFVASVVMVFLYNLFASLVGGIRVEVE